MFYGHNDESLIYAGIGEVWFNTHDCESCMRGFESLIPAYPTINQVGIKTIMVIYYQSSLQLGRVADTVSSLY